MRRKLRAVEGIEELVEPFLLTWFDADCATADEVRGAHVDVESARHAFEPTALLLGKRTGTAVFLESLSPTIEHLARRAAIELEIIESVVLEDCHQQLLISQGSRVCRSTRKGVLLAAHAEVDAIRSRHAASVQSATFASRSDCSACVCPWPSFARVVE